MDQIPLAERQCIPERVISDLLATKATDVTLSDFCVETSTDLDAYFYWICGSCTMLNSYRKRKCCACHQAKDNLAENSPVLRIAEETALKSKTTKQALSLVPKKDKLSIPEIVMDALVTCVYMIEKKGDLRRCRKPKLAGYDYCVAHCDAALLTTPRVDEIDYCSLSHFREDSISRTSLPREDVRVQGLFSRGISTIIEVMPSFLENKVDSIMVNELRWNVNSIEDSILCEENKPFPLGLKVRKFFSGYGFHDGRIIKVCRKFVAEKKQNQRPVLVYRMIYNDGDEEDFLHHEISSLCQGKSNRVLSGRFPNNKGC